MNKRDQSKPTKQQASILAQAVYEWLRSLPESELVALGILPAQPVVERESVDFSSLQPA